MTPFQIYLITRLDGLNQFLSVISILTGTALLILIAIAGAVYLEDGDYKIFKKWSYRTAITMLITLGVSIFIPTTKGVIAMYTIPAVLNNTEVQKLPTNVLKFANDLLETNNKKMEDKHETK